MADSRSIEEIPWAARLGVEWGEGVLRLKGGSKDNVWLCHEAAHVPPLLFLWILRIVGQGSSQVAASST